MKRVSNKSEELFGRSKKVTPGGVHSPVRGFRGVGGTPRFMQKANGPLFTDVDGNSYIDFCMALGPMIFGHQDPEISEAIREGMSHGWCYGTAEPYSLELAELITSSLPWVEKIRFCSSGTDAVMSALRLARGATGRNKVVKFDGCFHGHCDSLLVRAGSSLADLALADSAGVTPGVAADTIVAPLDDLKAVEEIFAQYGHEIAAVIIEPVPANNGLLIQTDEFLQSLSKLCKKFGALLIFDEVITGFRVSFGGMTEVSGIRPDLVTYGKTIGGGLPVAAYGGRADLMDLIAPAGPVFQSGTPNANPLCMSASLAMVKKLKRDNPYPSLQAKTEKLSLELEAVGRELGFPVTVQRYSSMFWPLFADLGSMKVVRRNDRVPGVNREVYSQVFHKLMDRGIYLSPSSFEVSFMSTAHLDEHLMAFREALKESLGEVKRSG